MEAKHAFAVIVALALFGCIQPPVKAAKEFVVCQNGLRVANESLCPYAAPLLLPEGFENGQPTRSVITPIPANGESDLPPSPPLDLPTAEPSTLSTPTAAPDLPPALPSLPDSTVDTGTGTPIDSGVDVSPGPANPPVDGTITDNGDQPPAPPAPPTG